VVQLTNAAPGKNRRSPHPATLIVVDDYNFCMYAKNEVKLYKLVAGYIFLKGLAFIQKEILWALNYACGAGTMNPSYIRRVMVRTYTFFFSF
jgi:hypothetical protein